MEAVEVLQVLSNLDFVDRIALHLIYWRGRTHTQVARELALPEATVNECVARGMRELAIRLVDFTDSRSADARA